MSRRNDRGKSGAGSRRGKKKAEKRIFPQVEGKVQMTREGFAFIIAEGEENDVFVRASAMHGALNGDIVRVAVKREKTEAHKREGEVIEIVERSKKPFIGVLHVANGQAWVLMQSRFMPYDISIPFAQEAEKSMRKRFAKYMRREEQTDGTGLLVPAGDGIYNIKGVYESTEDGSGRKELVVRSGMKVAAVVDSWARNETIPCGHIVDVLGEPGENDTEMHAILAEYALPYRFEPEVSGAADKISETITEADIASRRDFRNVLTFTIDPPDAKDFDDAISYRKLENGNYEVGVHIADVTHYVRPGSPVDDEAFKRGTSVYLVDRTVPMLPEKLSNKLCSLRPNEEKLTFSAVFELTPLGRVAGQWFGKTVIKSDWRFAYETSQQIIDAGKEAMTAELRGGTDGKTPAGAEKTAAGETAMGNGATEGLIIPDALKEAVLTLYSIASKLRKKRFAAGAISFERPEMKVEVDEKGRPVNIYQKISREANWLIEEFMLLANRCVAEFVATGCKGAGDKALTGKSKAGKSQAKTFVYRVHDEPNPEKVENLRRFISNFGYKMGPANNGKEISKELNTLFNAAKDTPEYNAIELLSLRTMAKARYDTENLGHYGLAFKYYTHFTSPIRRYPDMMVHRLLEQYLAGGDSASAEVYGKLCRHSSEREIVAAEAERASIKYKLVEFMQDKVGYEFDGNISGLTEWGIYVEINPTKIEGMVALRDIRSDFFEFDQDHYRIVGKRTHKVYNLGDPVRIRVSKANLEQKQIDYEFVEIGQEKARTHEHNVADSVTDGDMPNDGNSGNKAARKAKIRKAISESKKKARKKKTNKQ